MERLPKSTEDPSVIHAAFIRRCISITYRYGGDLSLGSHEALEPLPETEYPSNTIIGKRYITRMPHLPFANRWTYTLYNEQGAGLLSGYCMCQDGALVGEVHITHLSMGRPTATNVAYEFGDNKRVYSRAAIDNEQPPPPAALSFMTQVGVPVRKLGWNGPPPFHDDSWDSNGPLNALHVLAIMRVVNSQFSRE